MNPNETQAAVDIAIAERIEDAVVHGRTQEFVGLALENRHLIAAAIKSSARAALSATQSRVLE